MGKWLEAAEREKPPVAVSAVSADSPQKDLTALTELTATTQKDGSLPPEMTAKSSFPPETLDAEDWRAFFEERAGILEYDGGLDREKADRLNR